MPTINLKPDDNVQQAILDAAGGDTLEFAPGNYRSSGWTVPKCLRFIGNGANVFSVASLSGDNGVPRAILEFSPDASFSNLTGFTFCDAMNKGGNAAGIRLIGTKNVWIKNCLFSDCNNGLFCSGDVDDLEVEHCRFAGCGSNEQAHGAYLSGGYSAKISNCLFSGTVQGQALKSRMNRLLVTNCEFGGNRNRMLDLVNSRYTEQSAAVVVTRCDFIPRWVYSDAKSNWFYKSDQTNRPGNRHVIQFGDDTDKHPSTNGWLYVIDNKFVTPFPDSVLQLTSPGARACVSQNVFIRPEGITGQGNKQRLVETESGSVAIGWNNAVPDTFTDRDMFAVQIQSVRNLD